MAREYPRKYEEGLLGLGEIQIVMESGNSKAALLAFAKTIEHLIEGNLILNDSSVLGYGTREICSGVEVEEVSIGFQSIRGFKETFKDEYNRLTAYDFEVKETDEGVEVTANWIE